MADFIHLHVHSEYSLLQSTCRVTELAKKAFDLGQSALAITDSNVMYGTIPFYKECKKYNVKPIIGCEIVLSDGYLIVLLCKNYTGYLNLVKLISNYTGPDSISPYIDLDCLYRYSDGLIALSGGINGRISAKVLSGQYDDAKKYTLEFSNIFKDDFYLEITNHNTSEEKIVNDYLRNLSQEYNIKLVATNDVHYIKKADDYAHKVLCEISDNNISKSFMYETSEHYFKNDFEMRKAFTGFEDALSNTLEIASKCNVDFEFGITKIPVFKCEGNMSEGDYLKQLAYDGLENRINNLDINLSLHNKIEYIDRITYELSVIDKMGYSGYFLIVWDFINYARKNNIPVGPGRGSGAGSLIAYLIRITDVDPIAFNLLFERFLNPERVSMPDFDIDFGDTRRNEVIDYVRKKYGEERTAQIITFGTLAAKAVLRDVGRVLKTSHDLIETAVGSLPKELNVTISDAFCNIEFKDLYDNNSDLRLLVDTSLKLEGLPRHASIHAAGVVISEKPLTDYVPVMLSGGIPITQFDMNSVLELGLLKFDFLAIRYLTVINDSQNEIRKSHPDFDIENIKLDDVETYKTISAGNTDGVFQLESQGMKNVLVKMRPTCIDDITAAIALYRPGPMSSISKYIEASHSNDKINYCSKLLKPILDSTYGCIVYQEQVMQIFCSLAGYTLGHADIVRRAIAKKHADDLLREEDSFIEGCINNNISKDDAKLLFDDIKDFADYAFNKSHAVAYAVLSYRTAYLKTHFANEYYSALMSSVLGNSDKIKEYMNESKKCGVSIVLPDVNVSNSGFICHDGKVIFGLGMIKNLGVTFCNLLVKERESNGKFTDFSDFITRMGSNGMTKRHAEALIKSGACDNLGSNRSTMIDNYSSMLDKIVKKDESQLDMFSEQGILVPFNEIVEIPELQKNNLLELEMEYLGFYVSGSPFDNYSINIDKYKQNDIQSIINELRLTNNPNKLIEADFCGHIKTIKRLSDKNGRQMAFLTIELKNGFEFDSVAFSDIMDNMILGNDFVHAVATASIRNNRVSIRIKSIELLKTNEEFSHITEELKLYVKVDSINSPKISRLEALADVFKGNTQIIIYDSSTKKASLMKKCKILINDFTQSELIKLFGEDSVKLK